MSLEFITSRRSIRRYTSQAVSDDVILEILRAGMSAPSAGDEQPWHLVIVRSREQLCRIAEAHPYAEMAAHAQVAILVCGDQALEKHKGYWVQDCAALTQNILLSAHALGLGAVWVGIHPIAEREALFRELLSLPDAITPFALVPLGYPAERKEPANRFNPARIHRERW